MRPWWWVKNLGVVNSFDISPLYLWTSGIWAMGTRLWFLQKWLHVRLRQNYISADPSIWSFDTKIFKTFPLALWALYCMRFSSIRSFRVDNLPISDLFEHLLVRQEWWSGHHSIVNVRWLFWSVPAIVKSLALWRIDGRFIPQHWLVYFNWEIFQVRKVFLSLFWVVPGADCRLSLNCLFASHFMVFLIDWSILNPIINNICVLLYIHYLWLQLLFGLNVKLIDSIMHWL